MRKAKPSTSLYNVCVSEECRLIQEKLPAYSRRELPPDERDKVTGHLGVCSDCGQALSLLTSQSAAPAAAKSQRRGPNPALVGIVVALLVAAIGLRVVQSRRRLPAPVPTPAVTATHPAPSPVSTPASAPSPAASPASGPVAAAKAMEPFPPAPKAPPKTEVPKAPPVGRQIQLRLYAKDPMVANDKFLHLLAEIPAQLVEPPIPIRYDLLLQPDVAEVFLKRLGEIGPTEVQQETAGEPGAPVRVIVEILPRG